MFYVGLQVQAPDVISKSGGLGMFDIRPRRLVELGYATGLRSERRPTLHAWNRRMVGGVLVWDAEKRCERCKVSWTEDADMATCPNGRQIQTCEFILPWTQSRFLTNPLAQYTSMAQSMKIYYDAIKDGKLVKPAEASTAGALVVLHRGGKGALGAWPKLFEGTKRLYDRLQKIF